MCLYVCAVPMPRELEIQGGVSHPTWVLKLTLNSGPLQEDIWAISPPSPHKNILKCTNRDLKKGLLFSEKKSKNIPLKNEQFVFKSLPLENCIFSPWLVRVPFPPLPLSQALRPFVAEHQKPSGSAAWHPHKRPGTCVSTSQSKPASTQGHRAGWGPSGGLGTVWKCPWCCCSGPHPGTQRSCWEAPRKAVCTGKNPESSHR